MTEPYDELNPPDVAPCFCRDNVEKDDNWEPPMWSFNPDATGCPKHRPIKQYCRIHHNAFFGDCHPCQWAAMVGSPPEAVVDTAAVDELLEQLVDELS